jgi:hypothetical protein
MFLVEPLDIIIGEKSTKKLFRKDFRYEYFYGEIYNNALELNLDVKKKDV